MGSPITHRADAASSLVNSHAGARLTTQLLNLFTNQTTVAFPYSTIDTVTLETVVIQDGIAKDIAHFARLLSDVHHISGETLASTVSMCLSPYISLFVHESVAKLKTTDPALSASLSSGVKQIVARSRHSLRPLEVCLA
jgi:hypothetical protein